MQRPFEAHHLSKRFGATKALDDVSVALRRRSIVGLLGKNGSGKTTLMRHMIGLYLPSSGGATTLATPSTNSGTTSWPAIGYVPQEIRLLDWMTVGQHLEFVSSFYRRWDHDRRRHLEGELEVDRREQVGSLSTGNLQKVAVIVAVCHHPELLVLDEPVSDLDPIAHDRLLRFLLDVLREDEATIVVSSHVLRDVEKVIDWVICLDRGRLGADQRRSRRGAGVRLAHADRVRQLAGRERLCRQPDHLQLVGVGVGRGAVSLHLCLGPRRLLPASGKWFEPPTRPPVALWWIEEGHRPDIIEGRSRLKYLWRHGPSAKAFDLKTPFGPDGVPFPSDWRRRLTGTKMAACE